MFLQHILKPLISYLNDSRQDLDPCKAELIILGRTIKKQVNLSATYLESPCQNLGLSLLVEFQIFMQCIRLFC